MTRDARCPALISRLGLLCVPLLLAWPVAVLAQAKYPERPIRLIVPFPPGGSTTIMARLIGQKLTDGWGQQVVVDNRGGGNTISGGKRLVALPDVPTFTEAGLPGYEVKSWQGILAPAGTPKAIIDKLSQEITRILNAPEMKEQLTVMGADVLPGGPQQFAALIKTDLVRYAKLIKQANIKLE